MARYAEGVAAAAAALRDKGVAEPQATLAAEAGMSVLRVALERWVNGDTDLETVMSETTAGLRAVVGR